MPKRPNQQDKTERDQMGKTGTQGRDKEQVGKQGKNQEQVGKQGRGQDKMGKQGRGDAQESERSRKAGAKPASEEEEFDRWKEDQDLEDEPEID